MKPRGGLCRTGAPGAARALCQLRCRLRGPLQAAAHSARAPVLTTKLQPRALHTLFISAATLSCSSPPARLERQQGVGSRLSPSAALRLAPIQTNRQQQAPVAHHRSCPRGHRLPEDSGWPQTASAAAQDAQVAGSCWQPGKCLPDSCARHLAEFPAGRASSPAPPASCRWPACRRSTAAAEVSGGCGRSSASWLAGLAGGPPRLSICHLL